MQGAGRPLGEAASRSGPTKHVLYGNVPFDTLSIHAVFVVQIIFRRPITEGVTWLAEIMLAIR